ncbi:MAG: type II toxin-antitoxin system VapC family toxin [Proteobacteria bacterium]|jgi:predicted nucleic acid-binding protein|nr:type II toxin-antitoxin system VapC family toxin [Pseudomonadota bacterium]
MRGGFVVDNSVVMSWCFEDEASPYADSALDALRRGRALVPAVWSYEAANVLATAVRRKRLKREDARRFAAALRRLPIEVAPAPDKTAVAALLDLADETGLSAYDAAYLDLARREHLPLATTDAALRKAAVAAGVDLLAPVEP